RHDGRGGDDPEPSRGRRHHDRGVEDELLRRGPRRHRAFRDDAAASRQAHDGVADPRDGCQWPAPLAHDPNANGADMKIAFAGAFAVRLEAEVRAQLPPGCDVTATDEASLVNKLGDVDVLVSMAFTR